jgi:paraquat-inducible protein A
LTVASAIMYVIANSFPILGINLQGNGNAVTLLKAVHDLWNQGMPIVSSLTFVTAILVPALELGMMLYLLIPLSLGRVPAGVNVIMRFLRTIKPWGMIEVFMLGILVSLVKLVQDFSIIPGVALWSFACLTLLLAALASTFSHYDVWACIDAQNHGTGE